MTLHITSCQRAGVSRTWLRDLAARMEENPMGGPYPKNTELRVKLNYSEANLIAEVLRAAAEE